ncbi:MAG: hypothetical protein LBF78_16020 [Treponema sp.]|jgi:hypothetical protein|nr:hypothetical protein [Treponema sp.]
MNGLDNLIPILYEALQVVARELVGVISAASRSMTAETAAVGQTIRVPVTPPSENSDVVPGVEPPYDGTDFSHVDLTISKMRRAKPIVWTGNEEIEVGGQLNQILVNQYAQSIRSLVNELEADVAFELIMGALSVGNVYGTAGVTPFNGGLADLAQIAKILDDRGAPQTGRQFAANTAVGAALRSLTHLTNVDKAGDNDMLRRGVFGDLLGFAIRQSAGFKPFNPGAGAGYLINGAAAEGATELTVDTGSGAISKGAIISIAGDTNKYVVAEAVPSGGTVIKIVGGLKQAAADNAAITLGAPFLPSAGFTSDAIVLATRLPALPLRGDSAKDITVITDVVSGLSLQVAMYTRYLQNLVELRICWGCKSVNPEFSSVLIG